jgi:hypothetical protein
MRAWISPFMGAAILSLTASTKEKGVVLRQLAGIQQQLFSRRDEFVNTSSLAVGQTLLFRRALLAHCNGGCCRDDAFFALNNNRRGGV